MQYIFYNQSLDTSELTYLLLASAGGASRTAILAESRSMTVSPVFLTSTSSPLPTQIPAPPAVPTATTGTA